MKSKIIVIFLMIWLFLPYFTIGQNSELIIQGTITQKSDGDVLIGATVAETDANNRIVSATIADYNGHYVLKIKNQKNKLVFSFLGFISQTQEIGNSRTINVVLAESSNDLNEIVISGDKIHSDGTFSIPTKQISSAVQTIDAKALEKLNATSVDDALQGRIAGLDIVSNSGDLGAGSSMRIRGTSSINANSQPLIVVNGIPYEVEVDRSFDFSTANQEQYANMLSINPDDIEEITVLKDASSTAIWGSKGANGVLSIKTKKGATGKTRVQYSYRLMGARQPRGMNMLNGDDYTMLIKQAYFNPLQNENAANVREFLYDQTFPEYENFNNNTDWVSEVTQTGFKNDHYITIMGGGERAQFRVSGGYLTQSGTVIGQRLDRISSRVYLDYSVSKRMKFITELSYTYTDNKRNWIASGLSNDDNNYRYGLLSIAYRKMPNVSVYRQDADGNNTDEYYNISRTSSLHSDQRDLMNPVALAYQAKNNEMNVRILPTFRLQYDLLPPDKNMLRYNMYISFDVNNDKTKKFLPNEVSNVAWNDGSVNLSEDYNAESMTVMADNNITWQPINTKVHNLLVYGSVQIRTGNNNSRSFGTTNLPTGEPVIAASNGYLSYMGSSRYFYRSNALLFRAHYSLLDRYILDLTFRRDGSTKFGKNNKYGNFPGISAKWIISDEPFMASTSKWLSILAIRPSWGISGVQPWEEYLHYSRYSAYGSYMDMPATRPTTLQLSDLKWETTSQLNCGFDLGLFNNKLVFDLNIYKKRTKDLLFRNLSIPSTSGYTTVPVQNIGTMDNEGWELNFYTNQLVKVNNFTFDFNFNLSNYINTIVDLRDDVLAIYNADYDYTNGTYLSRIQEGNSFGSIYGFKYKGVYQYDEYVAGSQESAPVARDANGNVITDQDGEALPMYFAYGKSNEYEFQGGDAIYEDINHDGNIDELDIVYLGNSNPKLNGGFGTTLRYKNFAFVTFFNFRYGNKIVNSARMWAENMYTLNNQSVAVNWRWRKDGDVTSMPRALYNYGYNWLGSDRYVEDGSFLRLKYITFSYTVESEKLKKYKLQNLSIYLTINNIYTWTKYTGVDPEVGYGDLGVSRDASSTPRTKDATLGITITF